MPNEIEQIEELIKKEYRTKELFAEKLGMTRQNLNHHFRLAKKNNDIFSNEFKGKLWIHNVSILAIKKAKDEFHTATNLLNESEYGEDVNGLKQVIYGLNKIIEMQDEKIEQLQLQLKEKL